MSACLLGVKCRYDGRDAANSELLNSVESRCYLPLCPEQLGGLPTPRPAAEIVGGGGSDVIDGLSAVVTVEGEDVTPHFLKGAEEVLKVARLFAINEAILKDNSPSCGVNAVSRGGARVKTTGVTAELLIRAGINTRGIE